MSILINEGGPAFPFGIPEGVHRSHGACTQRGMTLRDWFAGQALTGLMMNYSEHPNNMELCAKLAVEAADAMIAAREVKPS